MPANTALKIKESLTEAVQVDDDIALLELMLKDMSGADPVYQWTNYWAKRCRQLSVLLRERGLKDFRRNRDPRRTPGWIFKTFGACDLLPPGDFRNTFDAAMRHAGNSQAIDISLLPASKVGNPEGAEVNGVFYTQSWLNYYLRYAYVSRFLNLSGKVIVEIGSGSGKQAHLLKMAHPDATLILFDIPPQLYVANQYLMKALGPDEVVDYRQTRQFTSFSDIQKGKVNILSNWQIGVMDGVDFDLLWNAASFQEMEPPVVKHYTQICRGARHAYLMQVMDGQAQAPEPGKQGVLEKTTLETYTQCLSNLKIQDMFYAPLAMAIHPTTYHYSDTFWSRK
jgi:hypothetical protein